MRKDELDNALAVLKQAMQMEQDGRQFYLKVAQTLQDEKGRETFNTLASDEQKHFRLIQRQFTSLTSDKKWTEAPEIKLTVINLGEPLFSKAKELLEKVAAAKSGERDALIFGLDIESKSYDLYRRAAQQTSDSLGRHMFEFLAGEERGHFDILMMRYDFIFGPIAWTS